MNTPLSPVSGRLASLDILRGFDLFLLVFFQPVFVALGQRLNFPWLNDILYQFDHESWIGFRFWDLVMPLFLFMTGASMPFSFSKFKNAPNKWHIYRKIIKRFVLLFIFGMIVQPEKEIVLMLERLEQKKEIVKAICAAVLEKTGEHALVYSLAVGDTVGLK